MTTIGIIGFGTIARQLHAELAGLDAAWLVLRRPGSADALPEGVEEVSNIATLIARRPAVVVEAAGQDAVAAHVPAVLRAGVPVVLASIGAMADPALRQMVTDAATAGHSRLILPSGAIGGLDYLRAVAGLPELAIHYTSRKPAAAWTAELTAMGLDPAGLIEEVVLFEGPAAEATRAYPKNLNVAFTLAMTAPDADLAVRVVADPRAAGNTHEIRIDSPAGRADFALVNTPSPGNPKTSLVTALSLRTAVEEAL